MQAASPLHFIAHGLLALLETGGLLWLMALLLASVGWVAWAASLILPKVRRRGASEMKHATIGAQPHAGQFCGRDQPGSLPASPLFK